MATLTRKVDSKARVTLPDVFAGQRVTLDQVSDDEVRVKLRKTPRKVPSLDSLLDGMTEANMHPLVDFGPPVGSEML